MMPDLILQRLRHDDHATLGELLLDGKHICHTLENRPSRVAGVKEPGLSRIPAGRHGLCLRHHGGFYESYTGRWGWHGPMIEIDLPGWDAVLFHIGNYHTNTRGCVLVGRDAFEHEGALAVSRSTDTYALVYPTLLSVAQMDGALVIVDEEGA